MPLLDLISVLVVLALVWWLVNTRLSSAGNIKWIVNIVMALLAVGIVLFLINTYIPMAGSIKAILNIVVVVATVVMVLQAFGLWGEMVSLWAGFKYRMSHPKPSPPERSPSAPMPDDDATPHAPQ